jgi:hypothetical protein
MEHKKRGRKKVADPKDCLRLYINRSVINAAGGEEAAIKLASGAIVRKANKNTTTKVII